GDDRGEQAGEGRHTQRAVLTRQPTDAPDASGISTREIAADEIDHFSSVLWRGNVAPSPVHPLAIEMTRAWNDIPGWRMFLAEVDGRDAAAALMCVDGRLALLAH